MSTTFIRPDFANRPYAPDLNNAVQQQVAQPVVESAVRGGFTDFIKDNKVMVIIFVLVVVVIICILIWMMTREKPKPVAEAPGPPNQRQLRGPAPVPPQQQVSPQQPPQQQPQQQPPQQQAAIETADDKELNRFMHLDEGSADEEKHESFTISESDDESKHDNIEDSVSVESLNE